MLVRKTLTTYLTDSNIKRPDGRQTNHACARAADRSKDVQFANQTVVKRFIGGLLIGYHLFELARPANIEEMDRRYFVIVVIVHSRLHQR